MHGSNLYLDEMYTTGPTATNSPMEAQYLLYSSATASLLSCSLFCSPENVLQAYNTTILGNSTCTTACRSWQSNGKLNA